MTGITKIITDKMQECGPISFEAFMEHALYCPGLGYYVSGPVKMGGQGDYLTSPTLTPVFAEMIGKQLTEMWEHMGRKAFTVVEYGGGTGALCADILKSLEKNQQFYALLDYVIIEKNPGQYKDQHSMLPDSVRVMDSGENLSGVSGCILSNELLDNFPVHLVEMQDELMEVCIGYENGFCELLRPAGPVLKSYFAEQKITLQTGFRAEANLRAIEWLGEISGILQEGYVLTFDYGYTSDELCQPHRKNGSILSYHGHKINNWPLANTGEQDITAHVNFSALKLWGSRTGLHFDGYTTQSRFLRSLGAMNELRAMESAAHPDTDRIKNLMTVMFGLGQKIKLMAHRKGIERLPLTGLQYQMPVSSFAAIASPNLKTMQNEKGNH